jgi:hypothetical protein
MDSPSAESCLPVVPENKNPLNPMNFNLVTRLDPET